MVPPTFVVARQVPPAPRRRRPWGRARTFAVEPTVQPNASTTRSNVEPGHDTTRSG